MRGDSAAQEPHSSQKKAGVGHPFHSAISFWDFHVLFLITLIWDSGHGNFSGLTTLSRSPAGAMGLS
jgi:hypothetical protein